MMIRCGSSTWFVGLNVSALNRPDLSAAVFKCPW